MAVENPEISAGRCATGGTGLRAGKAARSWRLGVKSALRAQPRQDNASWVGCGQSATQLFPESWAGGRRGCRKEVEAIKAWALQGSEEVLSARRWPWLTATIFV